MGLVDPFCVINNEISLLKHSIYLLENFCSYCQTDNRQGGCDRCPVGKLFDKCKEYIMDWQYYGNPISKNDRYKQIHQKYVNTMKKLQKDFKKINPRPMFNTSWIVEDDPNKDILERPKWYLKQLEHYHGQLRSPFMFRDDLKKENLKKIKIDNILLKDT